MCAEHADTAGNAGSRYKRTEEIGAGDVKAYGADEQGQRMNMIKKRCVLLYTHLFFIMD